MLYIGLVVLVLIAVVSPLAYKLYPKATCFDGKRNQDELGIDCDGSCLKVCIERTSPLRSLWARSFKVTEGVFSATAQISNANFSLGARNVPYTFKFYDERNVLIGQRQGVTDILPNATFPVFEGLVETGNRLPLKTFFEFTESPKWERLNDQPTLTVKNKELTNEAVAPRLSATLVNDNIFPIKNVSVVAVLYDADGTAIAASKTVLNEVPKSDSKTIIFTWPMPFERMVSYIDIYPEFLVSK